MGPEVYELEKKLADYVGVKHCIAVSSGSDSLLHRYDGTWYKSPGMRLSQLHSLILPQVK